jgi:hypothetical protein
MFSRVFAIFRKLLFQTFTLRRDNLTVTIGLTFLKDHHKLSRSRVDVSGVLRSLILWETSLEIVTVCINSLSIWAIHLPIFHRAAVGVSWTLNDYAISIRQVIVEKTDNNVKWAKFNAAAVSFACGSVPFSKIGHRILSKKTLDLRRPSHF